MLVIQTVVLLRSAFGIGLSTFSNPSAAPASGVKNVTYSFIWDDPEKPEIYKISDSLVRETAQPDIRQLSFYSRVPARADGLTVTVGQYSWTVTKNGNPLSLGGVAQGASITLATPQFSFADGDVYSATVTYTGLWGDTNTSDPYNHQIQGGMPGGQPFTLNLKYVSASGLGINSFSVNNTTLGVSDAQKDGAPVAITTITVTNGLELCQMINEINGGPAVRTIGTWDENSQIENGVVINYSGSNIDTASEAALLSAFPSLEPGRGYQVFIKPDSGLDTTLTFTIQ
jgi:hypothetical protein